MFVLFQKIKIYLLVGRFLHYVAFISFILFVYSLKKIINYSGQNNIILIMYYYFAYQTLGISIFAELDARSRFQNYKQVLNNLIKYGFREIIILPMIYSKCQRDAVFIACKQIGYGETIKKFFYLKGYRWYHVFPDFLLKNPSFILTKTFWKTTFFVPEYNFNYLQYIID
jgi:hypothetical protein